MEDDNEDDLKNKEDLHIVGRHTALDLFRIAVFFYVCSMFMLVCVCVRVFMCEYLHACECKCMCVCVCVCLHVCG